jgi:hypothetical protein
MFVVTADQVGSRGRDDIVADAVTALNREHAQKLALPVDRNAGDELQAMTADARTTLDIVLALTRTGEWSVGLGCGSVRLPLPSATREASGAAFFAARDAVNRAKKRPTRFAVETGRRQEASVEADRTDAPPGLRPWPCADDAESLLNLLLLMRQRRSSAGWELYDLIVTGMQQNEAAARLGISAPAANSRARAAGLKAELASIAALTRLLENLDRVASETDETAP